MRTSRVELGARGVRGEERDGRGRGEGEPLGGRGETTRRGPRIFPIRRGRAGDDGRGAANAMSLTGAELAGRADGQGER
jgi:hypothetical protein